MDLWAHVFMYSVSFFLLASLTQLKLHFPFFISQGQISFQEGYFDDAELRYIKSMHYYNTC